MGPQVWTGEVIETGRVLGGIPRSIAMTWSSDCNVEVGRVLYKHALFSRDNRSHWTTTSGVR